MADISVEDRKRLIDVAAILATLPDDDSSERADRNALIACSETIRQVVGKYGGNPYETEMRSMWERIRGRK